MVLKGVFTSCIVCSCMVKQVKIYIKSTFLKTIFLSTIYLSDTDKIITVIEQMISLDHHELFFCT